MAKNRGDVTLDELTPDTGGDPADATGDPGTNGEVKKTRVTLGMRGLANLAIPKEYCDLIEKAAKGLGMSTTEFFTSQYGDDFKALIDGHLQRDGAPLASLKDRYLAASTAKAATIFEGGA